MARYRFITNDDTSEFCDRVTKALSEGWTLYGDPQYAYDATNQKMRCGQAVVKETDNLVADD